MFLVTDVFSVMALHQFHAQLGINDTALTRALEDGDYCAAARMIVENTDPAYLNEGPYEKTPLAIVLSGDYDRKFSPRHLKLAMLLIQNGADPNLRIPELDFGGASPSAMEDLLKFYTDLEKLPGPNSRISLIADHDLQYEEELSSVIGLHDERNLSIQALKEQVFELIEFCLGAGGDPNVTTTLSNCSLFHLLMKNEFPQMELIKRFCDAGADVNRTDVHGTTPLMDLMLYSETSEAVSVAEYLWTREKPIHMDATNCANETALWRAMFVGQPLLSLFLLDRGACAHVKATIAVNTRVKAPKRKVLVEIKLATLSSVSALYAPLLQDSRPSIDFSCVYSDMEYKDYKPPEYFDKVLCDKIINSCIAPVVNAGHFNTQEMFEELSNLIKASTKFPHLCDSRTVRRHALVPLMFGNLSAGLRQLCVRQLLSYILFDTMSADQSFAFLKKHLGESEDLAASTCEDVVLTEEHSTEWSCAVNVFGTDGVTENTEDHREDETAVVIRQIKEEPVCPVTHRDIIGLLNPENVAALNKLLSLPSGMGVYFEIEAAKCQVASMLNLHESVNCDQDCEGDSDESLQTGSDWSWRDDDDDDYFYDDCDDFDDDYGDFDKFDSTYSDHSEHTCSSGKSDCSSEDMIIDDAGIDSDNRVCIERTESSDGESHRNTAPGTEKQSGGTDAGDWDETGTEDSPPDISRENYESLHNDSCDTEMSGQSLPGEEGVADENSEHITGEREGVQEDSDEGCKSCDVTEN